MKVAIVCDFLTKFGGAQKVLLALHEIYPDAPIFCLLYDEKGTKGKFKDCEIIPSKLQTLPKFLRQRPKFLIGSLAGAMEDFDLSRYDVVISSNDSYAHGVVTKPDTFHISYCHTPMRYAWDWHNEYLSENNIGFGLKGLIVRSILHKLRIWDRVSADRVDKWIANSENVKKRIAKYYLAEADVVYPPVETEDIKISHDQPEDFYVVASRLEPYKRINLAIEACNKLKKRLIVIGEGSEKQKLIEIAGDTIEFVGWKYGHELFDYLGRARAFVFPGEDDFGIAPVEAMAAGRPVIAFGRGGTLESIMEGKTGLFFREASTESLSDAIIKLEKTYSDFSPKTCRDRAMQFSKSRFLAEMKKQVEQGYKKHKEIMKNA